jgi:hypothetical protein
MTEENFLKVAENGSARILFSSKNKFSGICIDNLTTCTGIVVIGTEGIVVIHDEGFLDIESIENEFNSVGKIKNWTIFYNPEILKDKDLISRQNEMTLIINKYQTLYERGEKTLFIPTLTGKIFIPKIAESISEIETNKKADISTSPNISQRKSIRLLNNLYAFHMKNENKKKKHRIVPVDNQYDGNDFIFRSSLIGNYETIHNIVHTMFNGQKDALKEYTEALSTCFPSGNASTTEQFKPPQMAATKFEKLEKIYKQTLNQTLLLQLSALAFEAIAEYDDFESCEGYSDLGKEYLNLALKSGDKEVKEAAEARQDLANRSNSSEEEKILLGSYRF